MAAEIELPALEVGLPRYGGLRPLAEAMLAPLADQVAGETVVLNARRMTVWTTSYADGLVASLHNFGARQVLVVGATEEFADLVKDAGQRHALPVKIVLSEEQLPTTRVIDGLQPA